MFNDNPSMKNRSAIGCHKKGKHMKWLQSFYRISIMSGSRMSKIDNHDEHLEFPNLCGFLGIFNMRFIMLMDNLQLIINLFQV